MVCKLGRKTKILAFVYHKLLQMLLVSIHRKRREKGGEGSGEDKVILTVLTDCDVWFMSFYIHREDY